MNISSKKLINLFVAIIVAFTPIVLYPLVHNPFVQGKELFLRILVLILLLLIGYSVSSKKYSINKFWESKEFKIVGGLGVVTIISSVLSEAKLVSIYGTLERGLGLITYAYVLIFFLVVAAFLNKPDYKKILGGIFVTSVFIAGYSVLQRFGIDPIFKIFSTDIFEGRSFAFLGNPTLLGQYLAITFFLGFLFYKQRKFKYLIIVGQLIILWGILFAEARAALLALVLGVFILILKSHYKKKYLVSGLIILVTLGSLFALGGSSRFSFNEIATRSLKSRLQIWSSTIELVKEKPLFGYGPETFYIYFPEKVDKDFFELEEDLNSYADRVHNEFLGMAFSLGVFGAVFYLLLIASLIFSLYKTDDRFEIIILTGLIVNFIQNQFAFIDLSILVLISFLLAAKIEISASKGVPKNYSVIGMISIAAVVPLFMYTVIPNHNASLFFKYSESLRYDNYDLGVLNLKQGINHAPYYAAPWYDLMIIDPSSSDRALENIKRVEGESTNYLAWKANSNRKNLKVASPYYEKLISINPKNPHWVRAYGDAQYVNKNYPEAYQLYTQYLELVPDYWKWKDDIENRSEYDQKRYRIFFKNNPDFWNTLKKMDEIEALLQ